MIIETRYNVGDRIYVIDRSKIIDRIISKIDIEATIIDKKASVIKPKIGYFIDINEGLPDKCYYCKLIYEEDAFASKEELINSL